MIKGRICHMDMKPEHVMWDSPKKKIRFIDMARVSEVPAGSDPVAAVESMLTNLNLECMPPFQVAVLFLHTLLDCDAEKAATRAKAAAHATNNLGAKTW